MSRNPLSQVTFVLRPRPDLRIAYIDVDTVQLDVTLQLVETPQGLSGLLEYTDLFHTPSIAPKINQLRNLLDGMARDPGLRLRALPLLAPAELHQVVDLPSARAAARVAGGADEPSGCPGCGPRACPSRRRARRSSSGSQWVAFGPRLE